MLRYGSLAVLAYLAAIAVFVALGLADVRGSALTWGLRTVVFLSVAAATWRMAGRVRLWGLDREQAAWALIACGLTWFELGFIDMHVFRLFDIAHGSLWWDLVFHSSGPLVVSCGSLLLLPVYLSTRVAHPAR